jgi:hypothetical protein
MTDQEFDAIAEAIDTIKEEGALRARLIQLGLSQRNAEALLAQRDGTWESDIKIKPRSAAANESPSPPSSPSRDSFPAALAVDLHPISLKVEDWTERALAIAGINDPTLKAQKAAELMAEIDRAQADVLADPKAARAMQRLITAAILNGLADRKSTPA